MEIIGKAVERRGAPIVWAGREYPRETPTSTRARMK